MSKRLQQAARDRGRRARQRADAAEERAERAMREGDRGRARFHQAKAEMQREAAEAADLTLRVDRAFEGDQLGDESPERGQPDPGRR